MTSLSRFFICIILISVSAVFLPDAAAQFPKENVTAPIISRIEAGGMISVTGPEGLDSILSYHVAEKKAEAGAEEWNQIKNNVHVGYRVQVFEDNNVRTAKSLAQERKHQIENRFPEFQAYIGFNSPYWRVRVGDFRTRSEAEGAMGAIRAAFPSMGSQLRVVRDKINPR